MSIQGDKRVDKARQVGVFVGKVIAINPDAEQIQKLYGQDVDPEKKEPEYISEKDEDVPDHIDETTREVVKVTQTVKKVRIDFYVQDTKTTNISKKSFFLADRPFVKKDLTKQQYINQLGKTAWVDSEENLQLKFVSSLDKNGQPVSDLMYHAAVVGESELIDFLDNWLAIDKKKAYDISLTTSKLFEGDYRELQGLIVSDLSSLIMANYTVRAVDGPEGTVFYQDLWKKFLPAFAIKFFQQNKFTPEKLKEIADRDTQLRDKIRDKVAIANGEWLTNWEKYVLEMTEGEYRCKDFFSLEMAHDFDPETHYATAAASIDPAGNEY